MALCCMACCILFWLLVVAVGVAVLVVFLVYHPKPPRLRVTSATLNTGHIDSDARELSADLTVLAAISNPNAKLHIVLRYMQLGLYFEGGMIAAQAGGAAPLHEGPRGTVLRTVRLVASNVTMAPPAVFVWQNATTSGGGPVVLELAGRFHTQLNVGRWLRYRFWAKPRCTLWLDPPPGGALRRSQC
uniref:Late embryogenesis abundant protein LEA-2 subgroup domain-containing protein n=1 Tax=Oryza brachyantha TaxID=4533 RepID=J3L6Y9_ORYBR